MITVPQNVTLSDLAGIFTRYSSAIEEALRNAIPVDARQGNSLAPQTIPYSPDVTHFSGDDGLSSLDVFYGMLRYHMGWLDRNLQPDSADSGKKLRPAILLLCNEAAGGQFQQALPAAVAVELVHNFSLIHDDIEDRSDQRRHRDTVWKIWDEPLAINAGDAMFTLARMALYALQVSPERVLQAMHILDQTSLRLTEGQYMDMSAEHRIDISDARYMAMIGRKTAALISACCQLGSLIAGADASIVESFRCFGTQLGLSFQVRDDYLGIWGASADTGKPAADDLWKGKKTIPVIATLERANKVERTLLEQIYNRTERTESDIANLLEMLERYNTRKLTQDLAERYGMQAIEELKHLATHIPAQNETQELAQQRLAGLAVFAYSRDK